MDEMTALRNLRADAPGSPGEALAAGRARLLAEATGEPFALAPAPTATSAPKHAPELPRLVRRSAGADDRTRKGSVRGLAAVAAVTAAVVGAGVVAGLPGRTGSAGPGGRSAAAVLAAAAEAAGQRPAHEPAPGDWVFGLQTACGAGCRNEPGWLREDGKKSAVFSQGRLVGVTYEQLPSAPFSGFSGPRASYDSLAALPTQPQALLKELGTRKFDNVGPATSTWTRVSDEPKLKASMTKAVPHTPGPAEKAAKIVDLLKTNVLPPSAEAALYRALALVPGIEVAPGLVGDGFGRKGTAVSFDVAVPARPAFAGPATVIRHVSYRLVFDPATHTLLATQETVHDKQNGDAVVRWEHQGTGIVAGPGVRPDGKPEQP